MSKWWFILKLKAVTLHWKRHAQAQIQLKCSRANYAILQQLQK